MGTVAQHREKANHHLAFLETIPDEFPDWLATVAFYAAVEFVEMLLADRGLHSKSHEDRKLAVRRDFKRLFRHYHALYNASLNARYEAMEHRLNASEVRSHLIEVCLKHIQQFATTRIQRDS